MGPGPGGAPRPVRLFLAPIGAGANEPRLREGPAAILAALGPAAEGLAVEAVPPAWEAAIEPEDGEAPDEYARLHHLVEARALADVLAPRVAASLGRGELPVVLGGDHTVALGSFSGVRRALGWERRVGIVWVDAHPDLNVPETTPSNHGHGMPLAALLGLGHPVLVNAGGIRGPKLAPRDVALVGVRSVDPGEAELLARHPEMRVVTAAAIAREGLAAACQGVLEWARELEGLQLSIDLDAVDPGEAPGVTTPVAGGVSGAEAVELVRLMGWTGRVVAAEVVEHLPARDAGGRTARLGARLVEAVGAGP